MRCPRSPWRVLGWATAALIAAVVLAGALGWHYWRRGLPLTEGTVAVPAVRRPTEILRDRWGIPHVFADNEHDGYFALGWATAQDRLFQLHLLRRAAQGRLAEVFGEPAVEIDRLFRTLGVHRHGARLLAGARPEALAAWDAYLDGVNAYLRSLDGALPLAFALLGAAPEPFSAQQMVGALGLMAWPLDAAWVLEPYVERLAGSVPPERLAELFPYNGGGTPAVYPPAARYEESAGDGAPLLGAAAEALLAGLPRLEGSNSWAVAPAHSATDTALLANDTHMSLRLPNVWYLAHLSAGGVDVAGVMLPGFPFVAIGRNRDIAWGFTNLMLDGGDFFRERLSADGQRVRYRNRWVSLRKREEIVRVKGGEPVRLIVRETPHGPLVNDLLEGWAEPLSFRWLLAAAPDANEINAFHALNRATDWPAFRAAVARLGVVAQNVTYADRAGHVGMQAAGRIPVRAGQPEGHRFRVGWDGSQEWTGYVPFEAMPYAFDPPRGWVASANNPLRARQDVYVTAYWEPVDRIVRIGEVLTGTAPMDLRAMGRLQLDTVLVAARELVPLLLDAYGGDAPAPAGAVRDALAMLRGWDANMRADGAAPLVFAATYKHLFGALFEDEFGPEVLAGFRRKGNVSATMMRAVVDARNGWWLDRKDTPGREGLRAVLRLALERAVAGIVSTLGRDPAGWRWEAVHTLTLEHPLGKARLLAPLYNLGPLGMPGHANTVFKQQFRDADYGIYHGPTMRLLIDAAQPDSLQAVLPGGESGLPASPHYGDLLPLWRSGRTVPIPLGRQAADALAAERLVLHP